MMQPKLPERIVIASGNAGKLAEFEAMFATLGSTIIAQHKLGVEDVEETGLSFIENAILKARHASKVTNLPALADDSGLCVDALNGAPGLYSARYAGVHGDDKANNDRLLKDLKQTSKDQRGAFFISVLVLIKHAQDPAPVIAEGRWFGRVLLAPQGNNGFGYDPLFLPGGYSQSAAELEPRIKNNISHRGKALQQLKTSLGIQPSQ